MVLKNRTILYLQVVVKMNYISTKMNQLRMMSYKLMIIIKFLQRSVVENLLSPKKMVIAPGKITI